MKTPDVSLWFLHTCTHTCVYIYMYIYHAQTKYNNAFFPFSFFHLIFIVSLCTFSWLVKKRMLGSTIFFPLTA